MARAPVAVTVAPGRPGQPLDVDDRSPQEWRPTLSPWRVGVAAVLTLGAYAAVFQLVGHIVGS